MKLMKNNQTEEATAWIDKEEVFSDLFPFLDLDLAPPQVNLGHALFFAALLGRLHIVQTLLERGAKVVIC